MDHADGMNVITEAEKLCKAQSRADNMSDDCDERATVSIEGTGAQADDSGCCVEATVVGLAEEGLFRAIVNFL